MGLKHGVRSALRFRFRGREVALDRFSPRATVLDWLREDQRATGTKKAVRKATAAPARSCSRDYDAAGALDEAVNACIQFLASSMAGSSSPSRISRPETRCTRCSRPWSTVTAPNAASARRAS